MLCVRNVHKIPINLPKNQGKHFIKIVQRFFFFFVFFTILCTHKTPTIFFFFFFYLDVYDSIYWIYAKPDNNKSNYKFNWKYVNCFGLLFYYFFFGWISKNRETDWLTVWLTGWLERFIPRFLCSMWKRSFFPRCKNDMECK